MQKKQMLGETEYFQKYCLLKTVYKKRNNQNSDIKNETLLISAHSCH